MDKRKDYTISDKLLLVREILEAAEDHNKIKLELTVFSKNNHNNMDKICEKFKLHKKANHHENYDENNDKNSYDWLWYHNGSDKYSAIDSNILISLFPSIFK